MELPKEYLVRMQELLGEEYPEYLDSFSEARVTALRTNTRKISPEELKARMPFLEESVPWAPEGFYFSGGKMKDSAQVTPAKHPYYFAGLYYCLLYTSRCV